MFVRAVGKIDNPKECERIERNLYTEQEWNSSNGFDDEEIYDMDQRCFSKLEHRTN